MTMILVSAGRNCSPFLQEWHGSVAKQTCSNFKHLVIDDGSTDDSAAILDHLVVDGKLVKREINDRKWGLYNKSVAILEEMNPHDDDVIVSLDQDDFLLSEHVLELIGEVFNDPNVWLSYGGINPINASWDGRKVAGPMDWNLPPRKQPWRATSIRAWRWFLMKNILKKDLQSSEGNWLKFPEDRIVMYPMLEMAGKDHVYRYGGSPLYAYRDYLLESDAVVNTTAVKHTLADVLAADPYLIKTEKELRAHACDWI